MQPLLINSVPVRKLFLTGLIVYLFSVLGLFAPLHRYHDSVESHSHTDCPLCQAGSEAYLTPAVPVCLTEAAANADVLCELDCPILVIRYSAFSSRGPPAA